MLDKHHTVLVTGGDKGIGKSVVELYAGMGHKVLFTYNRNQQGAEELKSRFPNTWFMQCDYASQESIDNVINKINETTGGVDILVNNIGVDKDGVFYKMDFQSWYDVIHVNLIQIYHFCHALLPQMIENNWGRIINVSSIGAFTSAFGKSNYAASKSGIIGFTKSLSLEVAAKGITVNAICPGAIDTDMFYRIPEKYRDQLIAQIPMDRIGKPEEVADLIFFLASEKASFITGQTVHINGGQFLN